VATAEEFIAPIVTSLIAVPLIGVGVCETCRTGIEGTGRCASCNEAAAFFGAPPSVLPISLVTRSSPLYSALIGYKNPALTPVARDRHTKVIAALIAVFVRAHTQCLGPFDVVAAIPSESRTALRPALKIIGGIGSLLSDVLIHNGAPKQRKPADRFTVKRDVTDTRILLIDDTFASGATQFAAHAALRSAGASVVGPVIIGRFMRPEWEPSQRLLDSLRDQPWEPHHCARCRNTPASEAHTLF
jgi:hypothetical protein